MAQHWEQQTERSNPLMLRLLLWIARLLGRRLTRLLLWPITLYFLLTAASAKRTSRDFLRRALAREPAWRDLARHFHTFAAVSLDRLFLLGGAQGFAVNVQRPPEVYELSQSNRGCLLLLAHMGGFEVLRITGAQRKLPLRILMDVAHGRMLMSVLQRLNPELASRIIDASQRGPDLVLQLKQALDDGAMVGTMADRARADERAVTVNFLGGDVRLPAGPWILAGTLGVPVIIAFGLYRGGNRYDVHFELFAEKISLPRASREVALTECVQGYARRLEHYARLAPYNWFNFYDYWISEAR